MPNRSTISCAPFLDLAEGDALTLINENTDPQVIKLTQQTPAAKELFPTQVLFPGGQPYRFIVPKNAEGTYVYESETLPSGKTLTIAVVAQTANAHQSSATLDARTDASSTAPDFEIPLPFGDARTANLVSSQSTQSQTVSSSAVIDTLPVPASSSVASSAKAVEQTDDGSAVIELHQAQASSAGGQGKGVVETNPFTVANRLAAEKNGSYTPSTSSAVTTAHTLHSGAPLEQIRRPRANPSTGPGTWMISLGTIALFGLCYRRMARN